MTVETDLADIFRRLSLLEQHMATIRERLEGTTSVTEREFENMRGALSSFRGDTQRSVSELRKDVRDIQIQVNKWQGGSAVIYALATAVGGVVGWLLNHLGIGK